jgi:hypothetical protein
MATRDECFIAFAGKDSYRLAFSGAFISSLSGMRAIWTFQGSSENCPKFKEFPSVPDLPLVLSRC